MKVSVVTVCLNDAATIEAALESVARQAHAEVEHVVVDGGSTDGTLDILRRGGHRVSSWTSEPDDGLYDAMNRGVGRTTGDIVGFLHADDVLADDQVLAGVAEAMSDARIDAVYGDLCYAERDDLERVVRRWKSGPFERGAFAKGWHPPHPTLYLRRSVLQELGPYRTDFAVSSDFEYMLRAFEVFGVRSHYLPREMVRMRLGGTSNVSVRNIARGNRDILRAFEMHGISVNAPWYVVRRLAPKVLSLVGNRLLRRGDSGS